MKQKISPLSGSWQHLIDPLLFFSVVRVHTKHRVQWINGLGQLGMAGTSPGGDKFETVCCSRSGTAASLGITCSSLLQGLSKESGGVWGVFDGFMLVYDPSSAAPHVNVPWMWPPHHGWVLQLSHFV